jgi:16S rRNA A1518/A1519 N6-dimethyltransferase RsmA/KsgA/DIM1 with predicted DNA glycosylase/AP lyase activity
MNIPKAEVIKALESVGLPSSIRAENLTMEQFIEFSKALKPLDV